MALLDLLTNSDSYNISYGGTSKNITYTGEIPIPKYHLQRVEWDITDEKANPTFLNKGENHGELNEVDNFTRGGLKTFEDRAQLDYKRINEFMFDPVKGSRWLSKQLILHQFNPQKNTRTYTPLNTLTQMLGGGKTNIKKHGIIPLPADVRSETSPDY